MTAPNTSEESERPTISGLTAAEIALSDPLKAETRKARIYLLGVSMVGITIAYTGLEPQKINMLGINFEPEDRRSLLLVLALVILYFLAEFAIYGLADFVVWRHAHSNARWPEVADEVEKHWREYRSRVVRAEEESWPDTPESQWYRGERRAAEAAEQLEEERKRLRKEYADSMLGAYRRLAPSVSFVRAFFEFLLPLLVGFYAIYTLLVGPTRLGEIIAGVATVAAALITVLAVRRKGGQEWAP